MLKKWCLMEGAWSCYRGQYNGGRMLVSFNEREWSFYRGGQFNVGRMVMVQRWSPLMDGEWSCYGGGQFNGGRIVMLQRWQFNGGRMVMLQRWPF